MTEVSNDLIYQLMLQMQAGQEALTAKVGAMAETLIGIKRDIQTLDARVDSVDISVHRVRSDIATLAVAVDEHTRRLDRIEKQLNLTHA